MQPPSGEQWLIKALAADGSADGTYFDLYDGTTAAPCIFVGKAVDGNASVVSASTDNAGAPLSNAQYGRLRNSGGGSHLMGYRGVKL